MLRFFLFVSCILRLLCRPKIGKPGHPARKRAHAPHRSCTWLVPPHPSPAGSHRGDGPKCKSGGLTGGFVTLSKETIVIMIAVSGLERRFAKWHLFHAPTPHNLCPQRKIYYKGFATIGFRFFPCFACQHVGTLLSSPVLQAFEAHKTE